VVEARLQNAITGVARATVTSLAGLATELLVIAAIGCYGIGSAFAADSTLFAWFAGAYVIIAAAMLRARRVIHLDSARCR